jgi:hypothetical protein
MDTNSFEIKISVPHDARFAATMRGLAVHAAQTAGSAQAVAEAFGRKVEQAIHAWFERTADDGVLPIVLRRTDGPVEIVIDSRTITLDEVV